jgi:hypothetical protein
MRAAEGVLPPAWTSTPLDTNDKDFNSKLYSADIGTLTATLDDLNARRVVARSNGDNDTVEWLWGQIEKVQDAINYHKGNYDVKEHWWNSTPEEVTRDLQGQAAERDLQILRYNAELQKALGLKPPPPPATAEEFQRMIPKAKVPGIVFLFGPQNGETGYAWDVIGAIAPVFGVNPIDPKGQGIHSRHYAAHTGTAESADAIRRSAG